MKIDKIVKIGICAAVAMTVSGAFAQQADSSPLTIAKTEETAKEYLSDSAITAKVKEKLIAEKLFGKEKISAVRIHVKTTKGIVYLSGKTDSQERADNVVSLVKSVEGVKDVKSKIKVKAEKAGKAN